MHSELVTLSIYISGLIFFNSNNSKLFLIIVDCWQSAISKHFDWNMPGREVCARKRSKGNRDDFSLDRVVKKSQFKKLGSFISSGPRLVSVHHEPPRTERGFFRKGATTVAFLISSIFVDFVSKSRSWSLGEDRRGTIYFYLKSLWTTEQQSIFSS